MHCSFCHGTSRQSKPMTLGEFRKWTANLSDDVVLKYHYAGETYPVKSMDCLSPESNAIVFAGDLYDEENIMGSIRVATFCKQK